MSYSQSNPSSSSMSLSLSFLRQVEFVVEKVPDELRPNCPSCDAVFASFKLANNLAQRRRRHHCRLCGDVVCHDCSLHKVLLPLEGEQYIKPVRVCNTCHVDVERGEYFSMRRYITPLTLYKQTPSQTKQHETTICAALLAMAQDLNACLQDSTSFAEKVTLPASLLVPTITHYLQATVEIRDYAITTLSILLAVGSVVDRNDYAQATTPEVTNHILKLLEDGTRPIPVQEQAVRALFYLTTANTQDDTTTTTDTTDTDTTITTNANVRICRNMLDCCTSSQSGVSLQRWALATLQNCIPPILSQKEEEFDFVSCGAIMILCSLLSSDDADIRNHATAALTATLYSSPTQSNNIASSIYESGALQTSLVQMLLSADTAVVTMACTFVKCLLLTHTASFPIPSGLISTLIQIVSHPQGATTTNTTSRPLDLRSMALQILALLKSDEEPAAIQALIWQQVTTSQYWASRELSGWHLVEACCVLAQTTTGGEQTSLLRYWIQYLEQCPSNLPSAFQQNETVQCTLLTTMAHQFKQAWQLSNDKLEQVTTETLDAGISNLLLKILKYKIDYKNTADAKTHVILQTATCHILAAMYAGRRPLAMAIIPHVFHVFQSTAMRIQTYTGTELPLSSLLEGSLLAVGSICGAQVMDFPSSTAQVIPSSLFLNGSMDSSDGEENGVMEEDRKKMAEKACQVLGHNTFLPAILVGAFGEGCIFPALRLAYGISMISPKSMLSLVGSSITDVLKQTSPLQHRIPISMAMTILRHVGPLANSNTNTTATTSSAAIASLRDAIQQFHVYFQSKPSPEQAEIWTCLETECIWTLESLSQNPSLHSAIMSISMPQICSFLLTPGVEENTVCAALRIIQRIIPTPAHAIAAARNGVGTALCKLICTTTTSHPQVVLTSLEVLHTLSTHAGARTTTAADPTSRNTMDLFHCGAITAAAYALAFSTNDSTPNNNNDTTTTAMVTKLGLEILHFHIQDLSFLNSNNNVNDDGNDENNYELASIFVQSITKQKRFIQTLCSTLLLTCQNQKDANNNEDEELSVTSLVTPSLYGKPLTLHDGACAGYENASKAAISIILFIAALPSFHYNNISYINNNDNIFWRTFFLTTTGNKEDSDVGDNKYSTVVASCASLLILLKGKQESTNNIRRRILKEMHTNLTHLFEKDDDDDEESTLFLLLQEYQVPQTCLQLCSDVTLRPFAFPILEILLIEHPQDIVPLMISDAQSLSICLDLLDCSNTSSSSDVDNNDEDPKHVSRIVAHVIGTCAERGELAPAVEKFNLRSTAIASLSAACLIDSNAEEEDEDYIMGTEDGGSSVTKSCLHALVGIFSSYNDNKNEGDSNMKLSVTEAQTIASNLGAKLSNVVLQRFVKHAEEGNKKTDITNVPEVSLLCELASIKEALPDLCANGGLEALSLVANEGEISAIYALHEACKSEPALVLNVEGHISIMHVLTDEDQVKSDQVDLACMELLASLCSKDTKNGRATIAKADDCHACIAHASNILCRITNRIADEKNIDKETKDEEPEKERITAFWERKQIEKKDSSVHALELASLSLLSSLLHESACRDDILFENNNLIQSILLLASNHDQINLQYASLAFLWNALPYLENVNSDTTSTSTFSLASLSSTLLSLLSSRDSNDKSSFNIIGVETNVQMGYMKEALSLNQNLVMARALSLLHQSFFKISMDTKLSMLDATSIQLSRLLENTIATNNKKNYRRVMFKTNSGRLACEITLLMVLIVGSDINTSLILQTPVVAAMISLIIHHCDAFKPDKTSNLDESEELSYWNAATTNAIQFLSVLMMKPIESDKCWENVLADTKSTVKTFLPKNQFSKQRNVTTMLIQSLKAFALNTTTADASRAIVAKRILERIDP